MVIFYGSKSRMILNLSLFLIFPFHQASMMILWHLSATALQSPYNARVLPGKCCVSISDGNSIHQVSEKMFWGFRVGGFFFFFFFLGIRRIFEVSNTIIECKISTIVCLWRGMFCVLLQGSQCQDKALIYTSVNLIILFSVINYWLHIENLFLCHCLN